MNGGNIIGYKATDTGGGVCVFSGAFTMNGGQIAGCTVNFRGGGVGMTGNLTFTMNGGSISNCKATSGVDALYNSGTMNANGGEIHGTVQNDKTIQSADSGTTVFDGDVKNKSDIGSITISGGIFKGTVTNEPYFYDSFSLNWTKITGGEFYGEITMNYTVEGTTYTMPSGNITGGTFHKPFAEDSGITTCTVTLNHNDGGNKTTTCYAVKNGTLTPPTAPTREG